MSDTYAMRRGNRIIYVRLSPEYLQYVDEVAQAFNETRSEAIRRIIRDHRYHWERIREGWEGGQQ
ncbi:MAG: hypothetical protein ACP5ME_15215 [Anaerolineae bacterium]